MPPGMVTTAHPHLDRGTGGMLNYAAKLGPRNAYRFFRVDPDGNEPEVIAEIPVKHPGYVHSFGLTERHIVFAEFPWVVRPLDLALKGRPYAENFRWEPDRGTRFFLVDRATGRGVGADRDRRVLRLPPPERVRGAGRDRSWPTSWSTPMPRWSSSSTWTTSGPVGEITSGRAAALPDRPAGGHGRARAADRRALRARADQLRRATTSAPTATPGRVSVAAGRLVRPDPEGRPRGADHDHVARARLLARRAGLRGPARWPRPRTTAWCCRWCSTTDRGSSSLLVLDARRSERAGARRGAPSHPVLLPRAVRQSLTAVSCAAMARSWQELFGSDDGPARPPARRRRRSPSAGRASSSACARTCPRPARRWAPSSRPRCSSRWTRRRSSTWRRR